MITKEHYWDKPTYETMQEALLCLREIVTDNSVTKLAMPLIGCGLDRLEWSVVSNMVKDLFKDTNVEILVYYL